MSRGLVYGPQQRKVETDLHTRQDEESAALGQVAHLLLSSGEERYRNTIYEIIILKGRGSHVRMKYNECVIDKL